MKHHRTNDFDYIYRVEKSVINGQPFIDTISISKSGDRSAWVSSAVINVSSSRWSFGAFRQQGIAVYGPSYGRSTYWYAPQNFISVLEFANDSAGSLKCRPGNVLGETEVVITLRDNALRIKEVLLQLGTTDEPKSLVVTYADGPSPSIVTYTMLEQEPLMNVARPYTEMIEEANGTLVAKGELSAFKILNSTRIPDEIPGPSEHLLHH